MATLNILIIIATLLDMQLWQKERVRWWEMDKGQQLQSVLIIVMAILFGAFKSEFIGVCMIACMAMLIISVARTGR